MRRNTKVARMENADGEIDENYWAQAAAERAEDGDANMGGTFLPCFTYSLHLTVTA